MHAFRYGRRALTPPHAEVELLADRHVNGDFSDPKLVLELFIDVRFSHGRVAEAVGKVRKQLYVL